MIRSLRLVSREGLDMAAGDAGDRPLEDATVISIDQKPSETQLSSVATECNRMNAGPMMPVSTCHSNQLRSEPTLRMKLKRRRHTYARPVTIMAVPA